MAMNSSKSTVPKKFKLFLMISSITLNWLEVRLTNFRMKKYMEMLLSTERIGNKVLNR